MAGYKSSLELILRLSKSDFCDKFCNTSFVTAEHNWVRGGGGLQTCTRVDTAQIPIRAIIEGDLY